MDTFTSKTVVLFSEEVLWVAALAMPPRFATPPRGAGGSDPPKAPVPREARLDTRLGHVALKFSATRHEAGLRVQELDDTGIAFGIGLRAGDFVISIDGEEMTSHEKAERHLEASFAHGAYLDLVYWTESEARTAAAIQKSTPSSSSRWRKRPAGKSSYPGGSFITRSPLGNSFLRLRRQASAPSLRSTAHPLASALKKTSRANPRLKPAIVNSAPPPDMRVLTTEARGQAAGHAVVRSSPPRIPSRGDYAPAAADPPQRPSTSLVRKASQDAGTVDAGLCGALSGALQAAFRCATCRREEQASPAATASTTWMAAELRAIFLSSSVPTRTLLPGEVLVRQDEDSDAMFLLVTGQLVLSRKEPTGRAKTIGTLRAGAIIGELSFLLGTQANVTVACKGRREAGDGGSFVADEDARAREARAKASDGTVVAVLSHTDAQSLLEENPAVMLRFFRTIAAYVSQRILETASSQASDEAGGGEDLLDDEAGGVDKRSPLELARLFGLPVDDAAEAEEKLILVIGGVRVSTEGTSSGPPLSQRSPGTVVLFATHVCVEEPGLMLFTRRRAIPLSELLSVNEEAARGTIVLQMRGTSIRLKPPARLMSDLAQRIERHRLRMLESDEDQFAPQYTGPSPPVRNSSQLGARKLSEVTSQQNQWNAGHTGSAALTRLTLYEGEWAELLQGAQYQTHKRGERVITKGSYPEGLVQVGSGRMRIEIDVPGRPTAQVFGHIGPGEVVGEFSFLLASRASAHVVVETDEATTILLPNGYLQSLFKQHPVIATKFYCFLATRAAERLRLQTSQEKIELVMNEASKAPKTVAALTQNEAFLAIFDKFIHSMPTHRHEFSSIVEFVHAVFALHKEANRPTTRVSAKAIFDTYISSKASRAIHQLFSEFGGEISRAELQAKVRQLNLHSPRSQRHLYDGVLDSCLAALEAGCMHDFLKSSHYDYVNELRLKETRTLTMDFFQVVRNIGEGGFGEVAEVVKRDCGKRYALKVMKKAKIVERFGDLWDTIVLMERDVHAKLHHPLLINLAYTFQDVEHLWLVLDICDGGDLQEFGVHGEEKMTPAQLQFVGLEVLAIVAHLHSQAILFRDIKPANLLLDDEGHVRLIDFGTAKMAEDSEATEPPTSTEECGSMPYMAPEVLATDEDGGRSVYTCACDYFSFGVLLYELCEKCYPYGSMPLYEDVDEEFVQPELLDEAGEEVPHLYDLLTGLLDWDPVERWGGRGDALEKLKDDPYWGGADWELVEARRLPSPLKDYVTHIRRQKQRRRQDENGAPEESVLELVESFKNSQLLQNRIDILAEQVSNGTEISGADQRLLDHESERSVPGWEFVSQHALASEYVTSRTST